MILAKNRLVTIVILVALLVALPVALFLTQKTQDIRPRALLGATNFLLNTDNANVKANDTVTVQVSMALTNPSARASGVDFMLLYDRTKLQLLDVVPILTTNGGKFSEAPLITKEPFLPYPAEEGKYYFVRVALVSYKANTELPSGTAPLATVTFKALTSGDAVIKFPEDNNVLQVVGWGGTVTPGS